MVEKVLSPREYYYKVENGTIVSHTIEMLNDMKASIQDSLNKIHRDGLT